MYYVQHIYIRTLPMRFNVLIILCILFSFRSPAQSLFSEGIVWPLNIDTGIREHFVYGLAVAKDGTVLAFSEGRIALGDAKPHHIVLKRSKDNGKSWLSSQLLIESAGKESYANPTPVVDPETGKIFLFYALNNENKSSDVFYITSTNHGIKWSKPKRITSLFKRDPLKRPFHLPGPGHGIALKSGRLMTQVWHRYPVELSISERKYGVSVIYSDNHGRTWKSGGYLAQTDSMPANESRLVELSDGRLLLDCRNGAEAGELKRIQSVSTDKGITWSKPYAGSLPGFTSVDAGLTKITVAGKTYLLFTRPLGPGRNNLGISYSWDEGKTWSSPKLICKGPANYSDIAILPDNSIFVLYGRGAPRYAACARFNLQWLMDDNNSLHTMDVESRISHDNKKLSLQSF